MAHESRGYVGRMSPGGMRQNCASSDVRWRRTGCWIDSICARLCQSAWASFDIAGNQCDPRIATSKTGISKQDRASSEINNGPASHELFEEKPFTFLRKWDFADSEQSKDHGNWTTAGVKGVGELKGTKKALVRHRFPI